MATRVEHISEPRLPPELEREIMTTVIAANRRSIPKIVLIARRFQEWFEPEIYRVIRLYGVDYENDFPPLCSYQENHCMSRPSRTLDHAFLARIGNYVRHILLQRATAAEASVVLSHCPNTTDLVLEYLIGQGQGTSTLLTAIEKLDHLRELRIPLTDVVPRLVESNQNVGFVWHGRPLAINQPAFQRLTHLEIVRSPHNAEGVSELIHLRCLTHIAFLSASPVSVVWWVWKRCAQLKIVIYYHEVFQWPSEVLKIKSDVTLDELEKMMRDPRFVVLRRDLRDWEDWEKVKRGAKGYWSLAEEEKLKKARALADPLAFVKMRSSK